ncbi:T9SS type A sorting domain-containing protein [Niastella caeni]|uniref:T9SS type A sorting domain-containing protein n=1 Tax=Niastella caeni TaxID=2569763 RepID=A0A4S8HBG7_9BACT|nr:S8 family peptidase [Niastella caeni]THU32035.1 T9SS type A sorting domain-containing protein [Niastella caeni]
MKRTATLIILLIASTGLTKAQFARYIVQFTDKTGTPYTFTSSSAYLSAKAIARRTNQHIALDSTDLPVNPAYLDSIRKVPNVTVLNSSKWLNQVLIRTTDAAAITKINSFPFVKKTNAIAARSGSHNNLSNGLAEETPASPVSVEHVAGQTGVNTVFDYGSMYNQIHIHNGDYLHKLGFTGRGVTIAVLDAGFLYYLTNPAFDSVRLQGRVLGTWDYVNNEASVNEDNSHGAYVFSLLASNRPGVLVGSAPHASYWLLRTEEISSEYPVEEQNWVVAAEFADSAGVDMISTSLGYSDFDGSNFDYSYAQRNGNTAMISIAADLAAKKGILVVVSAGNSGNNSTDLKYVACPADADSVLTVGSIDVNANLASSSSWGPNGAGKLKPNIVSVGMNAVIAAASTGNPTSGSGTSYACPNFAGLAACFWEAFPEFTNMEIIDAIQKSANKYASPDYRFGHGIPNFKKAVALLTRQYATAISTINNCIVGINWKSKDDTSSVYTLQRKLPGETNFSVISTVASTSLSFKANSYTYNDTLRAAGSGIVQYRIVQNMRSADTAIVIASLQETINTVCFPDNTLIVVPSPFDQQLLVVVNTPDAVPNMGIKITDMMGRIVFAKKADKPAGYFSTPVQTGSWKAGIYEVTVYNNNKRIYDRKVFKK